MIPYINEKQNEWGLGNGSQTVNRLLLLAKHYDNEITKITNNLNAIIQRQYAEIQQLNNELKHYKKRFMAKKKRNS